MHTARTGRKMPMKGRESGMPDEALWNSFFDAETTLDQLSAKKIAGDVTEFGCGYGTFTLPAARRASGIVTALDIDQTMISLVRNKAVTEKISNINVGNRDFIENGTGLPDNSQAYAMLFNLLHVETPAALLREAFRILQPSGIISVIHWRTDIPTPRGPSRSIRPTPEQCSEWMKTAGFHGVTITDLQNCCPYHYGMTAKR